MAYDRSIKVSDVTERLLSKLREDKEVLPLSSEAKREIDLFVGDDDKKEFFEEWDDEEEDRLASSPEFLAKVDAMCEEAKHQKHYSTEELRKELGLDDEDVVSE